METLNPTTTTRRDELIEMFLDGTVGECYADGRLLTVENNEYDTPTVDLVAYGKYVIARYNEHSNFVRIFDGHYGKWSKTVSRYLTRTKRVADGYEHRRVVDTDPNRSPVLSGHSAEVAQAAKYIDNYITDYRDMSKVEAAAVSDVERALRLVARSLL